MKLSDIDLERFSPEAPTAEPVASPATSVDYVAKRSKFLTADGQTATPLEQEALFGGNDLLDVNFLDRCVLVRGCIARVNVIADGRRGWATGFLIAPGLFMTNNHVFGSAASVGASKIEFGYWFDVAGQLPSATSVFRLRPDLFFVTSKDLDYTVIGVAPTSEDGDDIRARRHLRLIAESGKVKEKEYVTILQYPEGAPMQVALRENEVVRAAQNETYIWYKADTAHGSSGSPVFNNSLQIVALHSGGRVKRAENGGYELAKGGTAADLTGLEETDVVWEANAGYRVSSIAADLKEQARASWPARVADIEAAMLGGDILSSTVTASNNQTVTAASPTTNPQEQEFKMADNVTSNANVDLGSGFGSVVIPLQLRISLEPAGQAAASATQITQPAASGLESEQYEYRMPVMYDGLDKRSGFTRRFLDANRDVPAPQVTSDGAAVLAPLLDGTGTELKYCHFSVWMHKERRIALYTAANVDWRGRRKTVGGKSVARDALDGWAGEGRIAELWALDPRMDERFQLPDTFYSNDRGAFDKGHITRRDDVCWGQTFEEVQMANGDTFHVTNCSPQRKEFNQGQAGQENWGDLESAIQKITQKDSQAACIYAGPVLRPDDRWFDGQDDAGKTRVRIPSQFWKIVVVLGANGFEAYGFILTQVVRDITEDEFYVTNEWLGAFKPISEIQGLMRGWLDLSEIATCDKHPTTGA